MANKSRTMSVQEAVVPYSLVYDLNDFKDAATGLVAQEFAPTYSVRFNTAGTYKVYFAARHDVAISQTYAAGEIEVSQIVKITASDNSVVASGKVFLYYCG